MRGILLEKNQYPISFPQNSHPPPALIAVGTGFFLCSVWIDSVQIISTCAEEILNTGVIKAQCHRFGLRVDQTYADCQRMIQLFDLLR